MGLIPDVIMKMRVFVIRDANRLEMSLRPISLLVGWRPTKATMGSRPERVNGHIGTEVRPRLLWEAAVGNFARWAKA